MENRIAGAAAVVTLGIALCVAPGAARAQEAPPPARDEADAAASVGTAIGGIEGDARTHRDPAGGGEADGQEARLTLPRVLELARARNPRVRGAAALAEARAVSRSWSGLLPDPRLQLGFMNFSLPGLDADMASSMSPSVQLTQTLPFPGKLALESEIADRTAEMAGEAAVEAWWSIRARAAGTFWELYETDRRLEVLRDTKRHLEDFETAARARYEAGAGQQTDVLQAHVEVARLDADLARAGAVREGVAARLNALLDRPAETAVPPPPAGDLPSEVPGADSLLAWAEATRPALRRDRLGVRRAEARVERAGKEIWPDLTLGAAYGQRRVAGEVQRMGSVMVGFELPVFAGRRQLRRRDEAAAMETLTRAELAESRAEVDARVGELVAELDRARKLVLLYRDEVLPQARTTVESAFASYRVGAVDFRTLVSAKTSVNRYEIEFHGLVAEYGRAVAELEAAVGRELPSATPLETEAR